MEKGSQMYATYYRIVLVSLVALRLGAAVQAQEMRTVEVRAERVADDVYLLASAGGNVGLSVGEDGVLLIDDGYAPLIEKITAAVGALGEKPIRFVINTHWHFDHVGGNERLRQAGAAIVAHENVRRRMSEGQFLAGIDRNVPPSPPAALPVITFAESLTFHWNGDEVLVLHVAPAHTDGDSFVYFRTANVLHVGDVWFNGMYPFMDLNAGGSLDGMIKAVDRALALANDKTKIIPGHGPLSDAAGLREYRDMLAAVAELVRALVAQGRSRDELIASKPTKDFDEKWAQGGMEPDKWVGLVYDGMAKK